MVTGTCQSRSKDWLRRIVKARAPLEEVVGGEILIGVVVEVRDDARELQHANGARQRTDPLRELNCRSRRAA